jgi:hypothetical protein
MSGESQHLEYIGVYNADASVWGEVSYWFGARLGVRHCSLCDVTHGMFRKRADWVQCAESLGVAFTTYHRDDAPQDVITAANGNSPSSSVVLLRVLKLCSTMRKSKHAVVHPKV